MDEDARCGNCVFCEVIVVRGQDTGKGRCRSGLPGVAQIGRAVWPTVTTETDWCRYWSDGGEDDVKIGGTE